MVIIVIETGESAVGTTLSSSCNAVPTALWFVSQIDYYHNSATLWLSLVFNNTFPLTIF